MNRRLLDDKEALDHRICRGGRRLSGTRIRPSDANEGGVETPSNGPSWLKPTAKRHLLLQRAQSRYGGQMGTTLSRLGLRA
jgi:hypothetical protein